MPFLCRFYSHESALFASRCCIPDARIVPGSIKLRRAPSPVLTVSLQLLALCFLPRFLLASSHRLTLDFWTSCVQMRRASPRQTLGHFLVSAGATALGEQICAPCTILCRPAHTSHHTTPCCRAKPPAKPEFTPLLAVCLQGCLESRCAGP